MHHEVDELAVAELVAEARLRDAAYGAFDIDSMPPATITSWSPARIIASAISTARMLDAHTLLIVSAGTSIGSPAPTAACRAGAWPAPPWSTWPMMAYSTSPSSTSTRSSARGWRSRPARSPAWTRAAAELPERRADGGDDDRAAHSGIYRSRGSRTAVRGKRLRARRRCAEREPDTFSPRRCGGVAVVATPAGASTDRTARSPAARRSGAGSLSEINALRAKHGLPRLVVSPGWQPRGPALARDGSHRLLRP